MSYLETNPMKNSSIMWLYTERDKIQTDPDYQRNGGVWTLSKRQLLIDSILNDYEEGAWTPTVTAQTGTLGSYTLTDFKYVRIGQLVNIMGKIKITSVGTGANALRLSLPFVIAKLILLPNLFL